MNLIFIGFAAGGVYILIGMLACIECDDHVGGMLPERWKYDALGVLALLLWPLACTLALLIHALRRRRHGARYLA